ncbi:MAG: phosphatidylserine decarboxylase [Planctomycetaceae bacterium]|nr:phosphatidylserine decarboxylase [Planctomycetaceae bacterium]
MRTRIEQVRQARQIHGGLIGLGLAALGVKLSRVPIPSKTLREKLWKKIYGGKYPAIDAREMEKPLGDYRSLNDLFTRGVSAETRCLDPDPNTLLCPCDSTVQDMGRIQRDTILTVKGTEYTLESLLPETDTERYHNGLFSILFLSPRDCHRVFSPMPAQLDGITHVPGSRLLVHPPFQKKEFPVFALNERVILRFSSPKGCFALVMVAGWGVGHITHPFALDLKIRSRQITHANFPEPRIVERGEWIATFELGSTVILITEPNLCDEALICRDQSLHYGQAAYRLRTLASEDAHG